MKKSLLFIFSLLIFVSCKNEEEKKTTDKFEVEKVEKTPLQKSISAGKSIYTKKCAQCHLATGKGIPKMYPPLRSSDWLTKKRTESIHAVKYGLNGEITVNGNKFDNVMIPVGLKDQEVVDVLNYVMNSWGNKQDKMVSLEEVKQVKK
ncbi:Cytochrome c [Mesonia phycicola]|uniref:Cytochrome c n=1 Tax=Mesonia phycicola TaxID=579105 RepID=A0A1M6C1F5_9FLAO|nr:cytochrome c [Mesonia phycicola]SHI54564.1 Cytochrome c [Mesonia phycicola]